MSERDDEVLSYYEQLTPGQLRESRRDARGTGVRISKPVAQPGEYFPGAEHSRNSRTRVIDGCVAVTVSGTEAQLGRYSENGDRRRASRHSPR